MKAGRAVRLPLGRADRIGVRARLEGAARRSAARLFGERGARPARDEDRPQPSAASRASRRTWSPPTRTRSSRRATAIRGIVALDADLIKDCGLVPFAQKYPDRFVECGIAEQDMVSMACGMARRGALPVVHSFACFLSARPNEQIYNQCSEALEGDLRRLARRPAARRPRPLAPVGARHLRARPRCRTC